MADKALTPDAWLEKLRTGEYASIGHVNRGIGKLKWVVPDKGRAKNIATAFFKDASTIPDTFRGLIKASSKGKKAAGATPSAAVGPALGMVDETPYVGDAEELYPPEARASVQFIHDTVAVNVAAIEGFNTAKQADPQVDISEMQTAVNNLAKLVNLTEKLVDYGVPRVSNALRRTPSNNGVIQPASPVIPAGDTANGATAIVPTGFTGFGTPPTEEEVKRFGDTIPPHLRGPKL